MKMIGTRYSTIDLSISRIPNFADTNIYDYDSKQNIDIFLLGHRM